MTPLANGLTIRTRLTPPSSTRAAGGRHENAAPSRSPASISVRPPSRTVAHGCGERGSSRQRPLRRRREGANRARDRGQPSALRDRSGPASCRRSCRDPWRRRAAGLLGGAAASSGSGPGSSLSACIRTRTRSRADRRTGGRHATSPTRSWSSVADLLPLARLRAEAHLAERVAPPVVEPRRASARRRGTAARSAAPRGGRRRELGEGPRRPPAHDDVHDEGIGIRHPRTERTERRPGYRSRKPSPSGSSGSSTNVDAPVRYADPVTSVTTAGRPATIDGADDPARELRADDRAGGGAPLRAEASPRRRAARAGPRSRNRRASGRPRRRRTPSRSAASAAPVPPPARR